MLISEAHQRGEIHKLLPQTHIPGVDYSLFIMETVEMSLGVMATTPAAPRRSFPPPICSSSSLFWCFCVSTALPSGKHRGAIFIVGFRSRGSFEKKDRRKRSHEAQNRGSHAVKKLAAWGYLFWPSGLHSFASFAHTPSSFQKMIPVNFQIGRAHV